MSLTAPSRLCPDAAARAHPVAPGPRPWTVALMEDRAATARAIVDDARYMVLGTADASGTPWVTPVWFAPVGYREFLWVSDPGSRHSRNVSARAEVGIVIFDSRAEVGEGQGLYMAATAAELAGADAERAVERFSARSVAQAYRAWAAADIVAPARLRLFRAVATEHFVLDALDRRVAVEPGAE